MYTKELNLNCLRVINPTEPIGKEIGVVPQKEPPKVSYTVTTPQQAKQQSKTLTILRITVCLMVVTWLFWAILFTACKVSEVQKCFTLMNLRNHMQSFQVAGGIWQEDYKPFYNELHLLAENDQFFAKHSNSPMSVIIITTLFNGLVALLLITAIILLIISIVRYVKEKSAKLVL